jgi:hypothetical protein
MNIEQVSELLKRLRVFCPAQRFDEHTLEAWAMQMDDIPPVAAFAALNRLARLAKPFISPGEIRKEVIGVALPPPEFEAFTACQRVAGMKGHGRSMLHPALQQAYDAMGGGGGVLMDGGTTVRAQFRDVYREIVEKHTEKMMMMDARDVLEEHQSRLARVEAQKERLQLEAAQQVAEEPAPASAEVIAARLAEMRDVLDKVRKPSDV